MFIIDFDDTLFDTLAFKMARLKAVKKLGVSERLYWTTYEMARRRTDGTFSYSDARHAEILALHGFEEEKVLSALRGVAKRIKRFLFPETEEFLRALKETGEPMILLSLGDPDFQEFKVKTAGLKKYFDRMFMVNRTKEDVIGELLKDKREKAVWLINDKVDEAQQLLFKFPDLRVVLKMSSSIDRGAYIKSGLPHFPTLIEVQKCIIELVCKMKTKN